MGVVCALVTLGECCSGEATPSSIYMYINIHYQPHILTHHMYIQPNDLKEPRNFSEELVRHQANYLGLIENIKVRRAGYAYRQLYDQALSR